MNSQNAEKIIVNLKQEKRKTNEPENNGFFNDYPTVCMDDIKRKNI